MSMMLGIMMTVSLCACSKKELPDGITTAGEAHTETGAEDRPQVPHLSIDKDDFASVNGRQGMYDQLTVMAENRKMWLKDLEFAGEVYRYAVADLDRNGRLELIVSDMGGTGIYTYSRFYEINESYDGLEECVTDFREGDSEPDIISETLKTYVDSQGAFYYAVDDLLRNGISEYYENVRSLTLQDGTIVTAPIAYRTTIFKEDVPVTSCTDGEGKEITEEEYEHAAETYFAGYQVRETKLGWQDMRELKGDTAEIAAQLDASLNVFLYSE